MSDSPRPLHVDSGLITVYERPTPVTEAGNRFYAALLGILDAPEDTYPDTVARVVEAYRVHGARAQGDCHAALKWFWSVAQPMRWREHLLDGWLYEGPDWMAFNETLMSAGAYIPAERSFEAIHFLFGLEPDIRTQVLDRYWEPLAQKGLDANAVSPDTQAENLLILFRAQPEMVKLLLYTMDADPLKRNTGDKRSALDVLQADYRASDPKPLALLQSLALVEAKACIPPEKRLVRIHAETGVERLSRDMAAMSADDL
jgi:hypothetical protein